MRENPDQYAAGGSDGDGRRRCWRPRGGGSGVGIHKDASGVGILVAAAVAASWQRCWHPHGGSVGIFVASAKWG